MAYSGGRDSKQQSIEKIEQLYDALVNFRHASYVLLNAWDAASMCDYPEVDIQTVVDEMGCDVEVPFTRSYDEWMYVLDAWEVSAMDDLSKLMSDIKNS